MKLSFRPIAFLVLISGALIMESCREGNSNAITNGISDVKVNDEFWGPKFQLWRTKTVNDVFNKFEGKYDPRGDVNLERDVESLGSTRNAFKNFDLVAEGKRGTGKHSGPPWYDGLVYETIRGASDFLKRYPDDSLQKRLDGYIDRIAVAQASGKDGYLNTYTQLTEPDHRWGLNGGFQRWQHDVYNAGMLVEAGVHHYKATGKTKLLNVAVKLVKNMYDFMGPSPKRNVVPAHSGPEEAMIKLYWLFKSEPDLKKKMDIPINEQNYYDLAKFWLESRGKHVGFPEWAKWGNDSSEHWIRQVKYEDPKFGEHRRPAWGAYAQDSNTIFDQKTIEGHAVRATLLATGIAAAAIENNDKRYIQSVTALWNNMVGYRMFITGGVGAIAHDEKFGSDFYLPNNAYLETCAGVGAGFFSQRMNELTSDGKYMDEFERVLYNNVLTGISTDGNQYTYQNPLTAEHHHRWAWHDCPCCPPMFLKMVSAVPDFIYLFKNDALYVNLFIGNEATLSYNNQQVKLKMATKYPWDGKVSLEISPDDHVKLLVKIRVPDWAMGNENPFSLYRSAVGSPVVLKINGESIVVRPVNGYVTIDRDWKKGDKIEMDLPLAPRLVHANPQVKDLAGLVAIASGPIVYGLEGNLNTELDKLKIDINTPLEMSYDSALLGGVNVITGNGLEDKNGLNDKPEMTRFHAIPYFALGNTQPGDMFKVWINGNQ